MTQRLPALLIVLDGALILSNPAIVETLHLCIYLEVPEKTRLARRKNRDIKERGRTLESVLKQFENQVKPMHKRFVEPNKNLADYIVKEENLDKLINLLLKLV